MTHPSATAARSAQTQIERKRTVVAATRIVKALLSDRRALYRLEHAIVQGNLDLHHQTIGRPIEIRNCVFLDDVDVRYAEFNGTVEFTGCEFWGRVLSGDQYHTRTVFRKDLIFNESKFRNIASFNRAYVEGNASFVECFFNRLEPGTRSGAEDGRPDEFAGEADFSGMQVERNFVCNRAIFRRAVSFNALRCRTAEFHGTRFEGIDKEIDFRSANFVGNIEFLDPEVFAVYEPGEVSGVECRPVVRGKLNLRGFKCERRAIFCGVEFDGPVDCEDADFGWYLDCRGACFKGYASFTRVTCSGAGLFQDASFEHRTNDEDMSADFRYASFESLQLSRAIFLGGVVLGQATIEQKLRLDETRFESDVLLYGARIGTIVLLNEGFNVKALPLYEDLLLSSRDPEHKLKRFRLHESSCARTCELYLKRIEEYRALLKALRQQPGLCAVIKGMTQPEGPRTFLRLQPEDLRTFLDLDQHLRRDRHLLEMTVAYFLPFRHRRGKVPGATWWGWADIRIRPLDRMNTDPTPDPRGVELNGCRFERIHAGLIPALADELIRAFVASQKIERFSRDVYLQLEQHYRQTGNDQRASQVHLWGHLATRRNAATEAGAVKWSRLQMLGDFVMMNTGWGHQTWRIGILCAVIVVFGTVFFSDYDGALRVNDVSGETAMTRATGVGVVGLAGPTELAGSGTAGDEVVLEGCGRPDWECMSRRAAYSLNTFVPAVSLGFEDDWVPATGMAEIVRFLLVVAGWVLVPLWAGSLTGLFKGD